MRQAYFKTKETSSVFWSKVNWKLQMNYELFLLSTNELYEKVKNMSKTCQYNDEQYLLMYIQRSALQSKCIDALHDVR